MDDPSEDEPLFDPRITSYNWLAGVLGGALTFVAGYLAMVVVVLVPDGPPEGAAVQDVLSEIGRVFYAAHNVALDIRTLTNSVSIIDGDYLSEVNGTIDFSNMRENETVIIDTERPQVLSIPGEVNPDLIYQIDLGRIQQPIQHAQEKPELLYYLLPVVALVAAGAVLAALTLGETASIHEAVLPAIALSAGYTAAAMAGTVLVGRELADGAIVVAPSLVQTVVFALAYSLLCGLVGGYLIGFWRDREMSLRASLGR
ncbi:putative membrane protein [Halapricum desulfuricans]|uniref:Putative membrane protein n=1 Tax=Halapricum desulfuricans TaxID=2841257 RepID=A0A897NEC9_9EURY|nr:hypothetical protein [Halapricum desulfuricans]QSG11032.1 putative membrane protein [Halapricum desulfuricans]